MHRAGTWADHAVGRCDECQQLRQGKTSERVGHVGLAQQRRAGGLHNVPLGRRSAEDDLNAFGRQQANEREEMLEGPFTPMAVRLCLQEEMKTPRREKRAVLGRQRLETRDPGKRRHFRIRRFEAQSERPQIAQVECTLIQSGSAAAIKDEAIAPEEGIATAKVAAPHRHPRAHRGVRDSDQR